MEEVTAAIYVSKVDMDVREHYYPVNQVPPDDPRLGDYGRDDWLARNKLLVWHDPDDDGKITFDVVKLDENSVFWVEIIGTNTNYPMNYGGTGTHPYPQIYKGTNVLNPKLPIFNKLTSSSMKKEKNQWYKDYDLYIVKENNYYDVLVRYGLDFDQSGSLEEQNQQGQNEIFGEYEIYGISGQEYASSRGILNSYLGSRWLSGITDYSLSHLSYALVYRVSYGVFHEPSFLSSKDYRPEYVKNAKFPILVTKNAYEKLTHRCGTQLIEKEDVHFVTIPRTRQNGSVITKDGRTLITFRPDPNGRKYPDAEANITIYYYDISSDAATLIREYRGFREKIEKTIIGKQISYDDIKNQYDANNSGRQKLTFPLKRFFVDFKPYGKIGLGGVSIDAPQNVIHLWVEMQGSDFLINQVYVTLRIEDMFDYNYFNPGVANYTGASRSAGMIQCGFGKPGSVANAGEVGLIRIDVDGPVEIGPIIKPKPTP